MSGAVMVALIVPTGMKKKVEWKWSLGRVKKSAIIEDIVVQLLFQIQNGSAPWFVFLHCIPITLISQTPRAYSRTRPNMPQALFNLSPQT
ncbi:hypothetical protein VNO78_18416 [Psophocarpus tetragonolobus]|uniref:Uncharacterized protein n=1 Tax=Psophocarpus tetragonolobus TaxID=3891 RepID=A0AAN9SKJ6_PSOTE